MAKIVIFSVNNDEFNYSVLIGLTETRWIEGKELPVPIGEATVTFPHDTPMDGRLARYSTRPLTQAV